MNTSKIEFQLPKAGDFRSLLQEELIARCRRNSSYSLRSFAKSMGISHSALAEMMNGKRKITKNSIEKLGLTLGLSFDDIIQFQGISHIGISAPQISNYQQITIDQFAVISDWYHFAILELIKIKDFPHTTADFSRALGISRSEANIALERLLRVGIIEQTKEGHYSEMNGGFATNISENLTSIGSRKLQKQILEQSIEALMNVSIEQRNHTSMTMAIDPKLIPEAISRIKKFRRELTEFLEASGDAKEVYQLSLSLFPITQLSNTKPGEER